MFLSLLLLVFLAACGGGGAAGSDGADKGSAADPSESFLTEIGKYSDSKLKDTTLTVGAESVRLLVAKFKIPPEELVEDIGFDQIEARVLLVKDGKELYRQKLGVEWGREQLKRPEMGFSPLVDFNFNEVADNKMQFRLMLVEYDRNEMHNLSYSLDANGAAEVVAL